MSPGVSNERELDEPFFRFLMARYFAIHTVLMLSLV